MDARARSSPMPTAPLPGDADSTDPDGVVIWRYPDMCRHWGVSRTTIERWVRRFEESGEGIPVRRDPSGRPYWLAHEAAGHIDLSAPKGTRRLFADDDRLERLRRAARRNDRGR